MATQSTQAQQQRPATTRAPEAPWRSVVRLAALSLVAPAVLFSAAGRLEWGMGWLYVLMLFAVTLSTRLLILRRDPSLLTERAASVRRDDITGFDRAILPLLVIVGPVATWIVAGLSQRFGWQPRVAPALQGTAVAVVLFGSVLASWAMAVNRFFSAVVRIQSERGHSVVSTGPYRFVRHPGYAGTVLVNLATPVMLDAWWALVPTGIVVMVLIVRTALEDRTLRAKLPGYAEYAGRTRYRLVPALW
jgi:protein-S-isoprenylcysteine O-methyltransferase Ste14